MTWVEVRLWHIASFRCAAEFGRYRGIADSDKPSTAVAGRHGRKFFCQIFLQSFPTSWLAFHGTGVLGDAPLGPPPGLEVDLIRLTTPAVTHEWSVANVDAILATLDQLYAVAAKDHPDAGEFLDRLAWLPPLLADLERPRLDA
jgi:hypothetical protein